MSRERLSISSTTNKRRDKDYKLIHKTSKFIIATLLSVNYIMIQYGFFSEPVAALLGVFGIFIWFFGVNTLAYWIESILHKAHEHDVI